MTSVCYLIRNVIAQIFNVPPGEMVYPAWMEGTWDVTCEFTGYQFPSRVPKVRVCLYDNLALLLREI